MKKMICPVTFQGAGPCVCACMRACVCGGGGEWVFTALI